MRNHPKRKRFAGKKFEAIRSPNLRVRQSLGRETFNNGEGTRIRAAEEDTYIIACKQDAANHFRWLKYCIKPNKNGERFMYILLYKIPLIFLKQKLVV